MARTQPYVHLVVSNPHVQGGEPDVRGSRVPVRSFVIVADEYPGDVAQVSHAFSIDHCAGLETKKTR